MKYFLITITFCFYSGFCVAQPCPPHFAGTKTLYQPQQTVYKKTPVGFQPVFINYAGRHGARHLTKDVNSSLAYLLLQKADSMEGLTSNGKKLQYMVSLLEKIEKTNFKSISYEGMMELEGIASRMYHNNRNVFDAMPSLHAVAITKEKRTAQSATAFVNKLKELLNQKDAVPQYINDTTLRFYDLSPSYLNFEKNGNWKEMLHQLKQSVESDKIIAKTANLFFAPSFLATINQPDIDEFAADIFGFITILPSIDKEINEAGYKREQLNFQSFYSCDELMKMGMADNAEDFLLKGPGTDNSGIPVKIAAPLLMDFIMTTDDFIYKNGTPAQLRFAHAETIAPFAALLNIRGASTSTTNLNSLTEYWKADEVIPLSANVQWILYRKKGSKDCLLKVLLNEKEVYINGLATNNFPYYSWSKARDFYLAKLHQLGLNPGDNYYQYLLKVK